MLNSKKNIEISVIVPTYNRSRLLDYTLFSLTEQSLPKKNFEVIVVDDGSDDNTKEVAESYLDILPIRYYFQEDKGYRPGSARNIGITNADGKICLLVDSGILLGKDCLKAHLAFHSKNGPNVAVLGYVFGLYPSHQFEQVVSETVDPYKASEAIGIIKDNEIFTDVREKYYAKYGDNVSQLPAPWVFFLSCNVSVSKQDLLHVKMFDEAYDGRWGCEDNDLGYRLHKKHIKIKLCRAAESFHYPHTGDMGVKVEQGYMNCIYFNSKFNTPETNLFLKHYKEIAISESVDINEELVLTKLK